MQVARTLWSQGLSFTLFGQQLSREQRSQMNRAGGVTLEIRMVPQAPDSHS